MHIKLKDNQYWVWSSKKASLDCLPQYKFDSLEELKSSIVFQRDVDRVNNLYNWAIELKGIR